MSCQSAGRALRITGLYWASRTPCHRANTKRARADSRRYCGPFCSKKKVLRPRPRPTQWTGSIACRRRKAAPPAHTTPCRHGPLQLALHACMALPAILAHACTVQTGKLPPTVRRSTYYVSLAQATSSTPYSTEVCTYVRSWTAGVRSASTGQFQPTSYVRTLVIRAHLPHLVSFRWRCPK